MQSQKLADIFQRIADILEIEGESPFKVNAYRKASRIVSELQDDIENLWQEQRLHELPGIGDALVKKIDEFFTTGTMKKYEELNTHIPSELLDLLGIQNLGPKTIGLAYKKLDVKNIDDLLRVIEDGSFAELPGMGAKKIENIKKGIERFQTAKGRISIADALPLVDTLIDELKNLKAVEQISVAGSARRMRETIGDIDILIATRKSRRVIEHFVKLPTVERVLGSGDTKGSVIIQNDLQVDLRAVEPDSFGAALQYFTGSKAHNVKLRGLARKQDLRINEYGIFRDDDKIGGKTEQEIYRQLGLDWIPPELREDRGEIEAAADNSLPQLLELKDIQGDLHVHSTWSDGHASVEQMAQSARERGYRFIAICDHSRSVHYANGLDENRLLQQLDEIDSLNEQLSDFRILKGSEVDILADGSLDFEDQLLEQLDIVVASIHTGFKQNVTARILKAMENPYVNIIAHPTGRLISRREGYDVDLNQLFAKASKTGTALEINAFPDRLDLNDINCRRAAEAGAKLVINTDSHRPEHLSYMKFGVGTARRGWLRKQDIINTKILEFIS